MTPRSTTLAFALALLIIPFLTGCKEDLPVGPPGSDKLDPAAAERDGFFLTGMGYDNAKVDLHDGSAGTFVIQTDYAIDQPSNLTIASGAAIGGKDTSDIGLVIRLLGFGKGSYSWDDLTTGNGFLGMIIVIGQGKAAGTYRSVSGLTEVTEFSSNDGKLQIAGKFAGTLKDSAGRTITVSGGRFTVD
jgi:hypothetical protein